LEARQDSEQQKKSVLDSVHDFVLEGALIDALEAHGAPNELLQDMHFLEAKTMSRRIQTAPALSPHVRCIALDFFTHFATEHRLDQSTWFQLVTLLDAYCQQQRKADTLERLPATCVALINVLRKFNTGGRKSEYNLPAFARLLGEWLRNKGISTAVTTQEMLNEQEESLLVTLDWNITIPSTESWLSMYCTRFSVLTQGLLDESVAWMREKTIFSARILMSHFPVTPAFPAHRQANGLWGLGLVSAMLLPLNAIRSERLCQALWEQLFLQTVGTMLQQVAVPQCLLAEHQTRRILELLCVTLGIDLKNLQQDCEDVALRLRSMLMGTCDAPLK
jgi:hypothetical protein